MTTNIFTLIKQYYNFVEANPVLVDGPEDIPDHVAEKKDRLDRKILLCKSETVQEIAAKAKFAWVEGLGNLDELEPGDNDEDGMSTHDLNVYSVMRDICRLAEKENVKADTGTVTVLHDPINAAIALLSILLEHNEIMDTGQRAVILETINDRLHKIHDSYIDLSNALYFRQHPEKKQAA